VEALLAELVVAMAQVCAEPLSATQHLRHPGVVHAVVAAVGYLPLQNFQSLTTLPASSAKMAAVL